jgi:hypothetical protein
MNDNTPKFETKSASNASADAGGCQIRPRLQQSAPAGRSTPHEMLPPRQP